MSHHTESPKLIKHHTYKLRNGSICKLKEYRDNDDLLWDPETGFLYDPNDSEAGHCVMCDPTIMHGYDIIKDVTRLI